MSVQRDVERRLLAASELEDVAATRYPRILELSRAELQAVLRRLREQRDRAQGISRQQRREMRGKSDARGTSAARDDRGSVGKAQVLAQAVKRANTELVRRDDLEPETATEAASPSTGTERASPSTGTERASPSTATERASPSTATERARAAFEMLQASRAVHHPSSEWTASTGMVSKPSARRTVSMDPREIGRVLKANKVTQAKRDR